MIEGRCVDLVSPWPGMESHSTLLFKLESRTASLPPLLPYRWNAPSARHAFPLSPSSSAFDTGYAQGLNIAGVTARCAKTAMDCHIAYFPEYFQVRFFVFFCAGRYSV